MPEDYSIPEEYQGEIVEEDFSIQDKTGQLTLVPALLKIQPPFLMKKRKPIYSRKIRSKSILKVPRCSAMHTMQLKALNRMILDTYDNPTHLANHRQQHKILSLPER